MKDDERRDILEMVADGKMSAAEASTLLSGEPVEDTVLKEGSQEFETTEYPEAVLKKSSIPPRWFHVHVSDTKTGKSKVRVNIPLRLVKYGLAIGGRFAPEIADLDLDELSAMMESEKGLLVDVHDDEDGERVLVFLD